MCARERERERASERGERERASEGHAVRHLSHVHHVARVVEGEAEVGPRQASEVVGQSEVLLLHLWGWAKWLGAGRDLVVASAAAAAGCCGLLRVAAGCCICCYRCCCCGCVGGDWCARDRGGASHRHLLDLAHLVGELPPHRRLHFVLGPLGHTDVEVGRRRLQRLRGTPGRAKAQTAKAQAARAQAAKARAAKARAAKVRAAKAQMAKAQEASREPLARGRASAASLVRRASAAWGA
jgi:hypothetical protein